MENKNSIPDTLKRQISEYRKCLFQNKAVYTLSAGVLSIGLSYVLVFISDRIWDTSSVIRLVLLLAGIASAAWLIYSFLSEVHRNYFNFKHLARTIQASHKELGDHLLGIIELAESDNRDENISEELKYAAIEKIAIQAASIDFKDKIDRKKPHKALLAMIGFIVIIIVIVIFIPEAGQNTFKRWISPYSSITRYTFTRFKQMNSNIFVISGEKNTIEIELSKETLWHPTTLSYTLSNGDFGENKLINGKAKISITGPNKKTIITFNAYDAEIKCMLIPLQRSVLKKLTAYVQYPKYLEIPDSVIEVNDGILRLLEHSKYYLRGKINRNLQSLNFLLNNINVQATIKDANFVTQKFEVLKNSIGKLNWKDKYGFTPQEAVDVSVKIRPDKPPITECINLARFTPVLRSEAISIKIHSSDDFGIKKIGIKLNSVKNKGKVQSKWLGYESVLTKGSSNTRVLDNEYILSAELLNIPAKTLITLHSWAEDYYPERTRAVSVPYQIYILSEEQHIKMIQDKLDKLVSGIEDSIRREENSLNINKKLSRMTDKKLQNTKTTEKILSQKLSESAEKREMKSMSKQGMSLVKEALKNKKFPSKSISQWTKILKKMNTMSEKSMSETAQNLNNAMKSSNSENRRKELRKAVTKQKENLKQMKQLLSSMNDSLEKLMLESFVNRLKEKAKEETGISSDLKGIMNDVIGCKIDELDDAHRNVIEDIKSEHEVLTQSATYISDDLEAFYARTRMKKYKKVLDGMQEFHLDSKLNVLSEYIGRNLTNRSILEATNLKGEFLAWAKILQKEKNSKDKPSNKKSKNQKFDMEMYIKFLKLIYGEQALRKKTRQLDKTKPQSQKDYLQLSKMLSAEQGDIHLRMSFIQNALEPNAPALKMLDRAGEIMNEVVSFLRKPQTDGQVIAAQTEIIEMLSGALKSSASKSGGAAGATAMAMLMQMMQKGSGAGMMPGGSSMGGSTDRINRNIKGKGLKIKKGADNSKNTQEASSLNDVPLEYKSAVELYFKKLKKIRRK